jgi:hypothetical protein
MFMDMSSDVGDWKAAIAAQIADVDDSLKNGCQLSARPSIFPPRPVPVPRLDARDVEPSAAMDERFT